MDTNKLMQDLALRIPVRIQDGTAHNVTPITVNLPTQESPTGAKVSPAEYRRNSKKARRAQKEARRAPKPRPTQANP